MNSEKLGRNYKDADAEKPAWKVERERDLARKKRIGEVVVGAAAAAIIGIALAHGAKTSEIMDNEERLKNVKKIEAEGIVFHDGVNARRDPYVDNSEPNQLATVGDEGESAVVDYDGEAYYYHNESDANGGWYGFEAEGLSDELLDGDYISVIEAENLKSDYDDTVWFNEKYVTVVEPGETA